MTYKSKPTASNVIRETTLIPCSPHQIRLAIGVSIRVVLRAGLTPAWRSYTLRQIEYCEGPLYSWPGCTTSYTIRLAMSLTNRLAMSLTNGRESGTQSTQSICCIIIAGGSTLCSLSVQGYSTVFIHSTVWVTSMAFLPGFSPRNTSRFDEGCNYPYCLTLCYSSYVDTFDDINVPVACYRWVPTYMHLMEFALTHEVRQDHP